MPHSVFNHLLVHVFLFPTFLDSSVKEDQHADTETIKIPEKSWRTLHEVTSCNPPKKKQVWAVELFPVWDPQDATRDEAAWNTVWVQPSKMCKIVWLFIALRKKLAVMPKPNTFTFTSLITHNIISIWGIHAEFTVFFFVSSTWYLGTAAKCYCFCDCGYWQPGSSKDCERFGRLGSLACMALS